MAIQFHLTLSHALQEIESIAHHELSVHPHEEERTQDFLPAYGDAKWKVVDLLNEHYSYRLKTKFDLYHWLYHQEQDEVAYFLNEAGSNSLNYSQFKVPAAFHLWMGKKGFVIGIEQQGKGFNAEKIYQEKIKENEGAAFDFFHRCQSIIFFDHPPEARTVFMLYRF